ncbi:hypothetical protein GSF22_07025 [Micromonospora echinofusca]|uniref:Uncharacterized protein n=1 Tax=Micromonospora echinofusca TaxID=47858 RepID=A0ABS3VN03_MICEH|nr:hypothetical protein [Micromonospora echinofusca]
MGAVHRHLLTRQLAGWAPAALARSRRATVVQAYDGPDGGTADAAVRVLAGTLDVPRGARLAVVVLAADPDDLAARLGAAEVGLSADVAVHLIPGGVPRLPVALKAAGAAGAPVLGYVEVTSGPVPGAEIRAVVDAGRPADILLAYRPPGHPETDRTAEPTADPKRPTAEPVDPGPGSVLRSAGLPLVTQVGLVVGGGEDGDPAGTTTPDAVVCYGTTSEKNLSTFKDALWTLPTPTGVRVRDAAGRLLDVAAPDRALLGAELLAGLRRTGSATVNDLRRFTLTGTAYRAVDAIEALTGLIDDGLVSRDPEHGRLGGEVVLRPVRSGPAAD